MSGTAIPLPWPPISSNRRRRPSSIDGSTSYLLQPDIKQETLFSAGSNRGQYESFLTLGFGGSGKDLQSNWTVSCQGMESIDGTQTAKLDLKPKQQSVANMFSHVTLWIDPTRSLGLKQIFYEPSGDNRTATYTGIKYNTKIPCRHFQAQGQGLQHHPEVARAHAVSEYRELRE